MKLENWLSTVKLTTQLNHGSLSVDFATLVLGSDGELYKMVPVLVKISPEVNRGQVARLA
jgi:dihydroorotate dehydrogenase